MRSKSTSALDSSIPEVCAGNAHVVDTVPTVAVILWVPVSPVCIIFYIIEVVLATFATHQHLTSIVSFFEKLSNASGLLLLHFGCSKELQVPGKRCKAFVEEEIQ